VISWAAVTPFLRYLTWRYRASRVVLAVFVVTAFAAIPPHAAFAQERLVVAVDPNYPPYQFVVDGRPMGFSVELLRQVADVMDLEVELNVIPGDLLQAALMSGEVDAAAGMVYSPDSDRNLDFTSPYLHITPAVFVRQGSDLRSLEDLEGRRIVVQSGHEMRNTLAAAGVNPRLAEVASASDALQQLAVGEYDGALLGRVQGLFLVRRYKLSDIEVAKVRLPPLQVCFAVRPDTPGVLARLTEGLNILETTGRFREIRDRWFGVYDERPASTAFMRYTMLVALLLLSGLLLITAWTWFLKRRVREQTEALEDELAERRRAEAALRASREQYRALVETMGEGLTTVDADVRVTFVNRRLCEILGREPDEVLGRDVREMLPEESLVVLEEQLERRRAGLHDSYELVWIRPDGKEVTTLVSPRPLRNDDGTFAGSQAVVTDITQRKQLEQRLARADRMESVGRLAGGVAHELNNVLVGVLTYPELVLNDLPPSSPMRAPLQRIRAAGEMAASVVEDLLILARQGGAPDELLNLNRAIASYLDSDDYHRLRSAHPGVGVSCVLEPGLLNIRGSSRHLHKAVAHLVANAMDSMADGGGLVISTSNCYVDRPIRGYETVEEGEYIMLQVSDTGPGLGPDAQQNVFDPFTATKVMDRRSSGLGMSVVWGAVADHRGYIDVDSAGDQGATFSLYFPTSREPLLEESDQNVDHIHGNGEMVMVVDDVGEQGRVACEVLTTLGYRAISVTSGEEAIEKLGQIPVDLVILDMVMAGGMDGLETFRKVHEAYPQQRAIIASGYAETDRVREAQALGAGPYVRKPYTLRSLGAAVRTELDRVPA